MLAQTKKMSASKESSQKITINYVKEKLLQREFGKVTYYVYVEAIYASRLLEHVRISLLTKDPSLYYIDRKQPGEFKDADLESVSHEIEHQHEMYNEIYLLYLLNVDAKLKYVEDCIKKRLPVPYKLQLLKTLSEEKWKKTEEAKEDRRSDLEEMREDLSKLLANDKKKVDSKLKNVKFNLPALTLEVKAFELHFVEDLVFKNDFLDEYLAVLKEASDYSFKCRLNDAALEFHSSFLHQDLLAICSVEVRSNKQDKPIEHLVIRILCLKCLSEDKPLKNCDRLKVGKRIWVDKLISMMQKLMDKSFMLGVTQKFYRKARFKDSDMKKIISLCITRDLKNDYIDISSLGIKLRSHFSRGEKVPRTLMMMGETIYNDIVRLFLKRINHSDTWYYIYQEPSDSCASKVRKEFYERDKILAKKNFGVLSEKEEEENEKLILGKHLSGEDVHYFLLMRIVYISSNRDRFERKNKQFLMEIFWQAYQDVFQKEVKPARNPLQLSGIVSEQEQPQQTDHNNSDHIEPLTDRAESKSVSQAKKITSKLRLVAHSPVRENKHEPQTPTSVRELSFDPKRREPSVNPKAAAVPKLKAERFVTEAAGSSTPSIDKLLQFEKNCELVNRSVDQSRGMNSIITIFKHFFHLMNLELQMMYTSLPTEEIIASYLSTDFKHVNNQEVYNLPLSKFEEHFNYKEAIEHHLIKKNYFCSFEYEGNVVKDSSMPKMSKEEAMITGNKKSKTSPREKLKALMRMVRFPESPLSMSEFLNKRKSDSSAKPKKEADSSDSSEEDEFFSSEIDQSKIICEEESDEHNRLFSKRIAVVVQVELQELASKQLQVTLRYYYALECSKDYKDCVLHDVKKKILECVSSPSSRKTSRSKPTSWRTCRSK